MIEMTRIQRKQYAILREADWRYTACDERNGWVVLKKANEYCTVDRDGKVFDENKTRSVGHEVLFTLGGYRL